MAYVLFKCRLYQFAAQAKVPLQGTGANVTNPEPAIVGKRFLVLDDEFLIAFDIQQVLESLGAAGVVCAGNATDALNVVQAAQTFDLAVLDYRLVGTTSSLDVADALVKVGKPFIFLTGMSGDIQMEQRYPDVPVVEKPYDVKLLIEAIIRALGAR
jgi:CheY-like chemotaxis protein